MSIINVHHNLALAQVEIAALRAEVAEFKSRADAARDAALAEAQSVAERCARERKASLRSCGSAGGAVESLIGKESEARRIADEIAALRGKA